MSDDRRIAMRLTKIENTLDEIRRTWRDLNFMLQMRLYQQLAKSRFCCATNLQPNFTNPVPPLAARLLSVHLLMQI